MFNQKLLIITLACLTLSACIVQPTPHKHKQQKLTKLEQEHGSKAIIVVNVKPVKHRKCRQHNRHWHCNKH